MFNRSIQSSMYLRVYRRRHSEISLNENIDRKRVPVSAPPSSGESKRRPSRERQNICISTKECNIIF